MIETPEFSRPLVFEHLTETCPRDKFCCGHDLIDRWIREKADKDHGRHGCVWTAHAPDDPAPVAIFCLYYSVSRLNRNVVDYLSGDGRFPSLRLVWLAVRQDCQGQGIGTAVMGRVVRTFLDQIYHAHIPALTVIPASDRAAAFYRRLGFVDLNNRATKEMVLSAAEAVKLWS